MFPHEVPVPNRRPAFPAALALWLAACGGAGDDGAPPEPTDPSGVTPPTGSTPVPTGTSATTTADTGPATDGRFAPVVEAILADLEANSAPGVSVAIMEGGEVTWAAGFGSARPDEAVAVDPDTLFQLGSTTKMYTALALLQQVEAGRLGLDAPLSVPLPGWDMAQDPGAFDTITPHLLMTHQGAFYDHLDWSEAPRNGYLAEWLQAYTQDLWLMAPPGRFMNYSNPNFMFGGLVLEAVDPEGRAYEAIVLEDVFGPLGMARSRFRKADAVADGHYALGTGIDLQTGAIRSYTLDDVADNASGRPAGQCTWSTPTEQLQMAAFLLDGDPAVLSDTLRQSMVERHVPVLEALDAHYGYGVFVSDGVYLADGYHPAEVWSHGGNTLGYTSDFYVVPSTGFGISILSSGYGQDFSATVAAAMTALAGLPPAVEPPTWPFEPDRLDDHVGTYADVANGAFTITREGDGLRIAWPFLEPYGYVVDPVLQPVSHDLWIADLGGVSLSLAFVGQEGSPSAFAVNRAVVGQRDDVPPVASRARRRVAPEVLEAVPSLFVPAAHRRR